jgi:hypothetical protein
MSREIIQRVAYGNYGLNEPAPTNAPVVDETVLAVLG